MLSDFLTFVDALQAVGSISVILRPLAYRREASCTPATSTHFRLSSSTVCKTDADTCRCVIVSQYLEREELGCKQGNKQILFPTTSCDNVSNSAKVIMAKLTNFIF